MATIAKNLQTLLEQKAAIKVALENQGKEPTDKLNTYAGLIDGLENPDLVEYTVTLDGSSSVYAQLYGKEKVTLTATANDIRQNTSAITYTGYTEGTKNIPSYQSQKGVKYIQANAPIVLKDASNYDYTKFQATLAVFNTSISGSVQVDKVTVDDALYEANSTTKLSDLTVDHDNTQINFGIDNGDSVAIMRYFIMREEE